MKCAICDFETDNTGKFRNHLRFAHKLSTKDYYDTYLYLKEFRINANSVT